jgi:hypothetical protein
VLLLVVVVSDKVWLMDGLFSCPHCASLPIKVCCTIILMECPMIVIFYSVLHIRVLCGQIRFYLFCFSFLHQVQNYDRLTTCSAIQF